MKQVIYILIGWALTAGVCWCCGKLLWRKCSCRAYREEENVFAFLAGSACLSLMVFLLCAAHLAYKGVFLGLSLLIVGITAGSGAWRSSEERLPALPRGWKLLFLVLWMLFGGMYFIYALAPEVSPDGTAYHLALVARYAREHGFQPITSNFFASLPQGMEMLFLFTFVWGHHSAAALVHCTYLLLLPWLILNYGRRIGMPAVGVAGGLLVFLSPVAAIAGASAYNDVALAAVAFAVFALLDIWRNERQPGTLLVAGLLAGFAFAIKYTGFIAAVYGAAAVAYSSWRAGKRVLRPVLLVALSAAVLVVPTLVRNWIVVQNPVSPFLNRVFPNPYVHVSFEDQLNRNMRSYEVHGPWELVYETTTRGLKTAGLLGPVFLLAPLSLLSLRSAAGRRLLLSALVFLLPYPANLGTRFLLPAATFVAPAIAIGLGGGTDRRLVLALKGFATWPWRAANPWRITPLSVRVWLGTGTLLALLVLVHAWLSWPSHIEWYAHHGAWRLTNVPIRAALRIQPEDEYIGNVLHEHFQMVRFIERATPPGSRIYSLGSLPEAYCSREILTSFYSASNERLRETLCAAIQGLLPPTRLVTFRISNQPLRRLRLVQTGSGGLSTPAVNEMRIFGPSGELRPGAGWRFYARPFPWDAGLAFDRNPTTRWSAWQEIREGAWIQVDFSKEETIAGVRLEAAPDQNLVQWVLQAETRPGRWSALPAAVEQTIVPAPPDLRRAATSELKRQAIRYLFVEPSYPVEDFNDHAREWGIRPLVHYGAAWLYYLE